jgi:hypothetical protein
MITGAYSKGNSFRGCFIILLLLQILSLGSEKVRVSAGSRLSVPSETECTQHSQGMIPKMTEPGQWCRCRFIYAGSGSAPSLSCSSSVLSYVMLHRLILRSPMASSQRSVSGEGRSTEEEEKDGRRGGVGRYLRWRGAV